MVFCLSSTLHPTLRPHFSITTRRREELWVGEEGAKQATEGREERRPRLKMMNCQSREQEQRGPARVKWCSLARPREVARQRPHFRFPSSSLSLSTATSFHLEGTSESRERRLLPIRRHASPPLARLMPHLKYWPIVTLCVHGHESVERPNVARLSFPQEAVWWNSRELDRQRSVAHNATPER